MADKNDTPPYEAWFVIEATVVYDRDNPLSVHLRGPFATEKRAEQERDGQQEAWQHALAEWDGDNPYDFIGWDVVHKHITDSQIKRLDRQDEESYRKMQAAADAVSAGLLTDEGVGPMAGDNND